MINMSSSRTWHGLSLFIFFNFVFDSTCGFCNVKTCSEGFLSQTKSFAEETRVYCVYLHAYAKCIKLQETSCRGDIAFYGTQTAVDLLIKDHPHCQGLLATDNELQEEADALSNVLQNTRIHHKNSIDSVCRYNGPAERAHCALFGDPHLVSFNGDHSTCVIEGAWPLIATRHLAIQVTNEVVLGKLRATAVTKVTVIIKSVEDICGSGMTYEASDNLPKAFVDGKTWGSLGWVVEVIPEEHVVINVAAINATVAIRKIDRFLQVLVSLPVDVSAVETEDVNLCVTGCSLSQQLLSDGGHPYPSTVSEGEAKSVCCGFNLTDNYLDSCMFDVMTTGEKSFGEAAYLAQQDMSSLNSDYRMTRKNCTTWPCEWAISSGAPLLPLPGILVVFALLLISSYR